MYARRAGRSTAGRRGAGILRRGNRLLAPGRQEFRLQRPDAVEAGEEVEIAERVCPGPRIHLRLGQRALGLQRHRQVMHRHDGLAQHRPLPR